jgi:hypothetical protein
VKLLFGKVSALFPLSGSENLGYANLDRQCPKKILPLFHTLVTINKPENKTFLLTWLSIVV